LAEAESSVLTVENVSVRFGGLQALDSVTLDVAPGEVHGLIGPNGAGKTTLFNVITGLQRPTNGRVLLREEDVTGYRPHARARLGLGRTFQRLELFGTLSARDNVQMAAEVQQHKLTGGRTPAQEAEYQLARVGILHVADEPSDSLPTGLARLVEMARALATSPSVLLLDEPSSGLNAEETRSVGEVLEQLASEGMGVLLVEHDMTLVMSICATVDVLDNGFVIAHGDPAAVQADRAVQEAYLGGDTKAATPAPIAVREARDDAREEHRTDGRPAEAGTAPPALRAVDVRAGYGRIEVLHGISLEVRSGTSMALLGPNGAGKTTLLNAISGQIPLSAGTVEVAGRPLKRNATENLARSGVCMIPEGRSIFPNLTVAENLLMYTFRRAGLKSATVEARAFERFPALANRRKQLAGTLSGGEQRMLAMARAMTTDPQILLLDELSMGLAPIIVDQLYDIVGQLVASEGLTIVMVEQFVQTALSIADEAAIMVHGELVNRGKPADIRSEVVGAYLGSETLA
jgi:ABC-type branched-subunit amino acid transport system ATPase component